MAKMLNRDNLGAFECEIIELFEEFLEEKGIIIENEEKAEAIADGDDCEIANIYGTDYGFLQSGIEEILLNYKVMTMDEMKGV